MAKYKVVDGVGIIPKGVKEIGNDAFSDCTSLTSVIIPEGVTEIGNNAFSGCTSLTSVVIPEGVTKIEYDAFKGCTSLINVVINGKIKKIDYNTFKNCTALESITLPVGLKEIQANAFDGCVSLKSIEIPSSVTRIEDCAFFRCRSLTNVVLPDGLTRIGEAAFVDCTSLTSVVIPEGVTKIENDAFEGCTSLINVVINGKIKKIDYNTFENCTALENITLPVGLKEIQANAFDGCVSLKSIEIPSSVTRIEDRAFFRCKSLTNIVLPDGLTRIGEAAFMDCTSLTSVVIPEGVRKIGDEAFSDCTSLTNVVISSMGTKIGRNVFEGCTSLTIAKRANQSAPAINDKLNSSDNSCNEYNSCNDENTKKVELMIKPIAAYRLYIFPIVGEEANALVDEYMYSEEFDADLVTELDYIIAEETDRIYEICVDFYSSKDGAEYSIDNINFKELEDNALWIDSLALGSYGIAHYGDDCSEEDFDEDFCLIGRIKMAHDYEYPMTKEIFKDIMDQHNRGYEDMDGDIIVDAIKRRMKQIAEQLVNDGLADDIDSVRFVLQYGEIYGEPFYVNIKTDEFDPNKLRTLKCDWNDCDNMPDILTEHYDSETLLQYIVYDEKFYELECGGINDFRFTVDLVNSDLESLRF